MRHRLVRPAVAALAAVLLLSACTDDGSSGVATADAQIEVVEPATAAALLDDAPADLVVLDVRTPQEFAAGRLPGAVNLDVQSADFRDRLDALDRDVPYLLYCRSGNRSQQARDIMADLGFTDVTDVAGGIAAWQAAGLPLAG